MLITDIFATIGTAITEFAKVLGNGFTSLLEIFYKSGEGGGLTPVGILSLIGLGVGIVYWAFRLVRSLIHMRG